MAPEARLSAAQWRPAAHFRPGPPEEIIIGLNNLLSVGWLSRGLELAATVARLVQLSGVGTGFLIAPDRLMTNHHVIPDADSAKRTTFEFNYQKSWQGSLGPVKRYEVDVAHFRTSVELDYTIVGLKGMPGQRFGYVNLAERADPAVNDAITIIQHPMGRPKEIAFVDNHVSAVFDDRLQYTTDTEPGSSGSPLFSTDWRLVGLHHAGGESSDKNVFTNEGILIGRIVRDAGDFLRG